MAGRIRRGGKRGHPIFARVYARRSQSLTELHAPYRKALLAGLSGRVLEVGCGNGCNFAYYPVEVSEVVGLEPEPYLRRRAAATAADMERITVVDATAERISDSTDGLFDAAVLSLVLCSVADPSRVLREVKKVLKPNADVRFFEHVVSDDPTLARTQHLVAPLWSRAAGGCRPDRDLLAGIRTEFGVVSEQRFAVRLGPPVPYAVVAPHILVKAVHRRSDGVTVAL